MNWRQRAACAGMADDTFFPQPAGPSSARAALAVCARCPVAGECLQYALGNGITYGIWGGTTGLQREIMLNAEHPADGRKREWELEHGTLKCARWERRHGRKPCDDCYAVEREQRAKNRARYLEKLSDALA